LLIIGVLLIIIIVARKNICFCVGIYVEYRQYGKLEILPTVEQTYSTYTLSEARSGVDWADLMAAQGAFGTDFYVKSTRTIVGTML